MEVVGSGPVPGVAGLVLTGGASRRMGRDKAAIVIEGMSCADRVGRRLSLVASPALEVGPGRSGLPVVREEARGQGPLCALVAGWRALTARGHRDRVIVLACDLPLVTEGLLRFLACRPEPGSVVPVVNGHAQPLCARFGRLALDNAARAASAGHRSLAPLLEGDDVTWLEEEDWGRVADSQAFSDMDSPADLRRLGFAI
ncbi:MAG: molybdenum cofactor guanylyltransferase [Actinobacteria bacterium]|nr:MAG: molybdenum cofactor guanylyltransferase [Actinomycetota bacterium]